MGSYYILSKIWQALPVKLHTIVKTKKHLNHFVHIIKDKTVTHNDLYNNSYYEELDKEALKSSSLIAQTISKAFSPKKVLDVGCGTGALLKAFKDIKIEGIGLEYSEVALDICHSRDLKVIKFDLERKSVIQNINQDSFDLVISLEVAEHLPESVSDNYIDLLCSYGKVIIFTAATLGQGGTDHVNEQPHEYWINKFWVRNYIFDQVLSFEWRNEWRIRHIAPWYYNNLMIFKPVSENVKPLTQNPE